MSKNIISLRILIHHYRMSPDIGDLKEFFHITDDSTQVCTVFILKSSILCIQVWPENNVPFQTAMKELYTAMHEVAMLILECMARALQLKVKLHPIKNI